MSAVGTHQRRNPRTPCIVSAQHEAVHTCDSLKHQAVVIMLQISMPLQINIKGGCFTNIFTTKVRLRASKFKVINSVLNEDGKKVFRGMMSQ